jgi:hypothetical protein
MHEHHPPDLSRDGCVDTTFSHKHRRQAEEALQRCFLSLDRFQRFNHRIPLRAVVRLLPVEAAPLAA